uniref:Uncharacterized protein n=1 Tax=Chrysemys picta bellii TaxID=8478 RepID=A0A8C3HX76_CHRPI
MPGAGELGFDSPLLPGFLCSTPRPSHQREPFNPTRIVGWCSCCSSLTDLGWVNNPTLGEFCFTMIVRANTEGSESDIAMNAWQPQGSYPCGNFSDTSCLKPQNYGSSLPTSLTYIVLTCQRLFTLETCWGYGYGSGSFLGANPFQGALPFTKERELSPGLPPASPGSVALPHWMPRGAHLHHSRIRVSVPDSLLIAEGNGGHRPSFQNGAYLSLRTD